MSTATTQITPIAPRRKSATAAPPGRARKPAHIAPDLADLARLSIKDVGALIGRGEQSIRDMVKAGKFPPADHRDGPKCVRWSACLVRRWLESTCTSTAK
jgi:predicted DNA-binding transcriptional regulator AlpA